MSGKEFIYIAPSASFFIQNCSIIISVRGSIRFRPRWESLNYSAPLPAISILDREWAIQESIYLVVPHS